MSRKTGIYKITEKDTGYCYIGQAVDLNRRLREHKNAYSNQLIDRYIREKGKDNFSFEIIEECDISQLNEREKYYIEKFNSYRNGFNQTPGGTTFSPAKGEKVNTAKLKDSEILAYRKRFVNEQIKDLYKEVETKISYSSFERAMLGGTYRHLPIYKKIKNEWIYPIGYIGEYFPVRETKSFKSKPKIKKDLLTDEQVLTIRKLYVIATLDQLYNELNIYNLSLKRLKKVVFNSNYFPEIPFYNKDSLKWENIKENNNDLPIESKKRPSNLLANEIINMRKIFYETKSYFEVIKAFPNIKFTFLKQIISGKFRFEFPYYSEEKSCWVFPKTYNEEKQRKFLLEIEKEKADIKKVALINSSGENNPRATLTNEQVMEIRRKSIYISPRQLVTEYNSTTSIIDNIVGGRSFIKLPYFNQKKITWVYPENWNGPKEQFILKDFLPRRSTNTFGEIIEIRYLFNVKHISLPKIKELLNITIDKINIFYIANGTTWKIAPIYQNNKWIIPEFYSSELIEQFNEILSNLEDKYDY